MNIENKEFNQIISSCSCKQSKEWHKFVVESSNGERLYFYNLTSIPDGFTRIGIFCAIKQEIIKTAILENDSGEAR